MLSRIAHNYSCFNYKSDNEEGYDEWTTSTGAERVTSDENRTFGDEYEFDRSSSEWQQTV